MSSRSHDSESSSPSLLGTSSARTMLLEISSDCKNLVGYKMTFDFARIWVPMFLSTMGIHSSNFRKISKPKSESRITTLALAAFLEAWERTVRSWSDHDKKGIIILEPNPLVAVFDQWCTGSICSCVSTKIISKQLFRDALVCFLVQDEFRFELRKLLETCRQKVCDAGEILQQPWIPLDTDGWPKATKPVENHYWKAMAPRVSVRKINDHQWEVMGIHFEQAIAQHI